MASGQRRGGDSDEGEEEEERRREKQHPSIKVGERWGKALNSSPKANFRGGQRVTIYALAKGGSGREWSRSMAWKGASLKT